MHFIYFSFPFFLLEDPYLLGRKEAARNTGVFPWVEKFVLGCIILYVPVTPLSSHGSASRLQVAPQALGVTPAT